MSTRPRLLVISPRFPYPVVGGDRLRLVQICEQFASDFDVTLVSLCESREEFAAELPSGAPFHRVRRVSLPRWRSYLQALLALPSTVPLQVAYYASSELREIVTEEVPRHDVVLAHLVRTAPYLPKHGRVVRVLEMTDAISLNYSRAGVGGRYNLLRRLVYGIERSRLLRAELRALTEFDVLSLVSSVDRDFLAAHGGDVSSVVVCTNGVRLEWPRRVSSDVPFVAFIGNMTTVQNLDAARYYAREVHPKLFASMGIRFRVIGRIGRRDAQTFRGIAGVDVTGELDEVGGAAAGAIAGICSVRIGAGVQNKILEYMAMGLPVVTSSVGLEGLEARPGTDLLVADTPEQWVQALAGLRRDPVLASRLSEAGLAYVREHHDWARSLAPLVARVRTLAASRGGASPHL